MNGLEFILKVNKISFTELAEKLGIKKQNISMWLSGERKIPQKYLSVLEDMFNVKQELFMKELTINDLRQ